LADALSAPDIPITTVERRFNEFKKKWDIVQDTHGSYSSFAGDMETAEAGKLDEWIEDISNDFDQMEIKADRKIEQLKPVAADKLREDGQKKSSEVRLSAVKVERMKFDKFEGDIRRYPQFKEEFTKHVAPSYLEEQRAFVLKGYLAPNVREEVESCGEDYGAIWKRLDQRFGDRGKIINEILNEVTLLSPGDNDDSFALQMIKVVEKAHRDLKRLRAEEEMYNATMIVTIEKRMPNSMRQEWAKEIAGKEMDSAKKFLTLLDCLQNWRNRIEYLSDGVRSVPSTKPHPVNHMHEERANPSSNGNFSRQKCWIHELEHPVWRCREFLAQSIEGRIKLVEQYKACKVCLNTLCPGAKLTSDCNRWRNLKCLVDGCQEIHSRWLHPARKISGSTAHTEGGAATGGRTILQTQ